LEWTLKHADAVCSVTRDLVESAKAVSFRDDVRYTPNGVDVDFWKPIERDQRLSEELNPKGGIVLGFVGELRAKKAPAVLLDAFAKLNENIPAKLLLIGGARREELESLNGFVKQYPRLGSQIQLIDYIDSPVEMRRYYGVIDIALFPSLWEGMSNALLESMAMEKIVAASDVGGNKEAIEDEKSGFLIPRSRLNEFSDRLMSILLYPREKLIEIAGAARLRMIEEFSIEKERLTLISLIDELIG